MTRTRRQFLTSAAIGLAGITAGCLGTSGQSEEQGTTSKPDTETTATAARPNHTAITEEPTTEPSPATKTVSLAPSPETSSNTRTAVTTYSHSVTDLKIYNETSDTLTVTVTVTRLSKTIETSFTATTERPQLTGKSVLSATFELQPSVAPEYKSKVYQNPLKSGRSYAITIDGTTVQPARTT
jgi:Flp pilus assembly protein TadG